MKKIILTIASALISLGAFAQSQVVNEHDYSSFTGISLSEFLDVVINPSGRYTVRVTCDSRIEDYVSAYVKGGVLNIGIDTKSMPKDVKKLYNSASSGSKSAVFSAPKIEICLPSLSDLTVEGNTTVRCDATVNGGDMTVTLKKGAVITNMVLSAGTLAIDASQKSEATMNVEASSMNVTASKSATVNLNATVRRCIVNGSNSATVEIYGSTDYLSVASDSGAQIKFESTSL